MNALHTDSDGHALCVPALERENAPESMSMLKAVAAQLERLGGEMLVALDDGDQEAAQAAWDSVRALVAEFGGER